MILEYIILLLQQYLNFRKSQKSVLKYIHYKIEKKEGSIHGESLCIIIICNIYLFATCVFVCSNLLCTYINRTDFVGPSTWHLTWIFRCQENRLQVLYQPDKVIQTRPAMYTRILILYYYYYCTVSPFSSDFVTPSITPAPEKSQLCIVLGQVHNRIYSIIPIIRIIMLQTLGYLRVLFNSKSASPLVPENRYNLKN